MYSTLADHYTQHQDLVGEVGFEPTIACMIASVGCLWCCPQESNLVRDPPPGVAGDYRSAGLDSVQLGSSEVRGSVHGYGRHIAGSPKRVTAVRPAAASQRLTRMSKVLPKLGFRTAIA